MVDPSCSVLFRNGLPDREIQFAKIACVKGPTHGQNDFMILKEVRQLAAGGPNLSNVGFQFDQFLFDGFELLVCEVVKMGRVRLVVTKNLSGHVNGGKVVPDGDFLFVLGIPEDGPRVRGQPRCGSSSAPSSRSSPCARCIFAGSA